MRYLQAGSGPPLILIHGLMGYSFSWRFTIPALAPHATVYAIDNLGAGLSPANEGMDCTVCATAERVLQFADAVGIKDFDLLGTSHGGGVAIMVAAACAEGRGERKDSRLQRLILVAPVNPWSPHGKRLAPFVGSAFGSLLFLSAFESWPSLHDLGLRRLFGDGSKIPPDSLEGYRIPLLKNHVLRHAARIVRNWTADLAELEAALPKIRDYPDSAHLGNERSRRTFSIRRAVAPEFSRRKAGSVQGPRPPAVRGGARRFQSRARRFPHRENERYCRDGACPVSFGRDERRGKPRLYREADTPLGHECMHPGSVAAC